MKIEELKTRILTLIEGKYGVNKKMSTLLTAEKVYKAVDESWSLNRRWKDLENHDETIEVDSEKEGKMGNSNEIIDRKSRNLKKKVKRIEWRMVNWNYLILLVVSFFQFPYPFFAIIPYSFSWVFPTFSDDLSSSIFFYDSSCSISPSPSSRFLSSYLNALLTSLPCIPIFAVSLRTSSVLPLLTLQLVSSFSYPLFPLLNFSFLEFGIAFFNFMLI